MNRRLHKLPFHKFEKFVSYKAIWRIFPLIQWTLLQLADVFVLW